MKSLIKKTKSGFSGGSNGKSNLKIDVNAAEAEHDQSSLLPSSSRSNSTRGKSGSMAQKSASQRGGPATPPTVSTAASADTSPSSSLPSTPRQALNAAENGSKQNLTVATPQGRRGAGDIRSPGAAKTPRSIDGGTVVNAAPRGVRRYNNRAEEGASPRGAESADEKARLLNGHAEAEQDSTPVPDFITQTDRYGNATTPRSAAAIQAADESASPRRKVGAKTDDQDDKESSGSGSDSLFDSLRVMCCCLLLDDGAAKSAGYATEGAEQATGSSSAEDPVTQARREMSAPSASSSASYDNIPEREGRRRLLPKEMHPKDAGKKCLVLDLDETLVHSSFRAVPGADFVIPVQVEDVVHSVYVAKRPHVDAFLRDMADHYEIVIYTASLNKYADPLLDLLDVHGVIRHRLFRESCVYHDGHYVKDLSLLNRDLPSTIIVDNSPNSYIFHPDNAIDCSSFIDDPSDRELIQIGDFLKGVRDVDDVRNFCNLWRGWPNIELGNGAGNRGNGKENEAAAGKVSRSTAVTVGGANGSA